MPVTLTLSDLSEARSGSGVSDQAVSVREQHGMDPVTRLQLSQSALLVTLLEMPLYGEPEGATFLVLDALLGWLLRHTRRVVGA